MDLIREGGEVVWAAVGLVLERGDGSGRNDHMRLDILEGSQHLEHPSAVDRPTGSGNTDDDPFLDAVLPGLRHSTGRVTAAGKGWG